MAKSNSSSTSSRKSKPSARDRLTADFGEEGMIQYYPDGTVLSGRRVVIAGDMCIQKDGQFVGWKWKLDPGSVGYD